LSARRRVSRAALPRSGARLGCARALPPTARSPPRGLRRAATPRRAVNAEAWATLEALLDRLIPSDANGPGALEAGVAVFLRAQLAGPLAAAAPRYAHNLAALEDCAQAGHARPFAALSADERDALVAALAEGRLPGFEPSAEAFFELVRLHAIQGMFSDPAHGGNEGEAGWDLIGFPGVKRLYTAEEQQLDVAVPRVRRDG